MPFLVSTIESLRIQIGPFLDFQKEALAKMKRPVLAYHRDFLKAARQREQQKAADAICADISTAAEIIRNYPD